MGRVVWGRWTWFGDESDEQYTTISGLLIRKRVLSFSKRIPLDVRHKGFAGDLSSATTHPFSFCSAQSRVTPVKNLIDYTRCDQCLANIKIGPVFFKYTFQLICITHPFAWEWKNYNLLKLMSSSSLLGWPRSSESVCWMIRWGPRIAVGRSEFS